MDLPLIYKMENGFPQSNPVVCHIHGANPELPVTDRHKSKSLRDLTKSSPLDLREEKVRDPISCTDSQSICIEWRNWSIPWLGKRVHGSSHFIYDVPHPDDPHTMSMSARRRKHRSLRFEQKKEIIATKRTIICIEIRSIGGIGWNRIRFARVSFARLKESFS